ncbi:MAG: chitobiase/beta-hexosaminidase C-terminal domain-containing protein, partial [Paramuribaculum sp.]|nr:chitobiase/beta-hexosaminidase C-terminal domain-containing protein [Paramuribaculum sp.]
ISYGPQSKPEWTLAKGHKFYLGKYMFENIKKTTITVKFKLMNTSTGIESEPVTVEITMHDITPDKCVDNIKDFKDLFINTDNLPETGADNVADNTNNYYRLQEEQGGYARIREVSDKYLYIRTNLEDESKLSNQELSDHSILLYNKHGWENTLVAGVEATIAPAAVAEGDTEEEPADLAAYTLKPGDIITNFALIPTRSGYGNLIADISDFTRTIRRVEGVDAGHNDPITVEAADFTGFTDADRMLRYRVEDVMVKKVPDSSEKGFYYYLDIPGKPVLNNGGVFEELTGWDVMQDDNAVFNLEGVVMLANGGIEEGQDGRYMFALVPPTDDNEDDYNIMPGVVAPGAPVITISGDFTDNENGTFLTKAYVTIKADVEGATIYYTDDDSDPRTNSAAKTYTGPFTISKNTVIKAFATAKGAPNSEVSGAYFERTLTESKYVINFILGAQKDVPYHFTGNVRVAAKGGDYFFVRGTQGHYLPINVKNNSIDLSKVNVGGYINDMVITPHIVATNGRNIVRGAHITPEYKSLFTGYSDTRPGTLKEDIMIEPDSVTTLTVDNARRFVKLSGVELKGITGTDAQATTQWTLKTDKGDGAEIRVNHNILEPEFDFDKVDDNAYYNVTGFAMLGTDGVIELWPTKVEQINNTLPVAATVKGNIISQIPGTADNPDVSAEFYPYTTVSLAPTGHGSAVIYYWISKDKKEAIPANAQWNVYSQEFAVTKSCYIHAMAIRPGYEASVHTHITLTLAQPAQPVDFSVDPQAGKTIVTMTAAAGAKIFWSTDKKTWNEYTAPVPFTQQTTVYAYAKEGNRNSATVSMFVMIQTTGGTADASKMSGKLTISHRLDEENGKYLITIAPENESLAEGTYTIHYTTDGTTPTVNSTVYNGEFEMPKTGGVVLAILKEHAKEYPGEVAHLNISYIPTGIDGIDSDRDESDAVRAEGGNIIAPEGSEVYDITGRRVATTCLRSGIYIVKVPGAKAVKVKVD